MGRVTIALALVLVFCPAAWAQVTPTDAIRDVFSRADAILVDPATRDRPLDRLTAIRKLVSEAFDARSAAELASGEHWETRTPAEQQEFSRLLGELLERSFVSRMAMSVNLERGLHVDYLGELVNGATARVHTAMNRRGGGQMLLDYRMIDRDGVWKIRDVAIDGVSVMANYRAQLDRVLINGSFSDLLAQMRARAGAPDPPAPIAHPPAPEKPVVAAEKPVLEAEKPVIEADKPVIVADKPVVEAEKPVVTADQPVVAADTPVVEEVALIARATSAPELPAPTPEPPVVAVEPTRPEPTPEPRITVVDPPRPAVAEVAAVEPVAVVEPPRPAVERVAAVEAPRADPPPPPAVIVEARTPDVAPANGAKTRAYWLRMSRVENLAEAGQLVRRLGDSQLTVTLERASAGGALRVDVRVGPFRDAEEAVLKLLDLQAQGQESYLVAERE